MKLIQIPTLLVIIFLTSCISVPKPDIRGYDENHDGILTGDELVEYEASANYQDYLRHQNLVKLIQTLNMYSGTPANVGVTQDTQTATTNTAITSGVATSGFTVTPQIIVATGHTYPP